MSLRSLIAKAQGAWPNIRMGALALGALVLLSLLSCTIRRSNIHKKTGGGSARHDGGAVGLIRTASQKGVVASSMDSELMKLIHATEGIAILSTLPDAHGSTEDTQDLAHSLRDIQGEAIRALSVGRGERARVQAQMLRSAGWLQ